MGLQLMLHCQCGYTCGIKAALDRHLAKFAGTEFEHEHGPSLPAPSLPARGVRSAPLLEFGKDFYESTSPKGKHETAVQPVSAPGSSLEVELAVRWRLLALGRGHKDIRAGKDVPADAVGGRDAPKESAASNPSGRAEAKATRSSDSGGPCRDQGFIDSGPVKALPFSNLLMFALAEVAKAAAARGQTQAMQRCPKTVSCRRLHCEEAEVASKKRRVDEKLDGDVLTQRSPDKQFRFHAIPLQLGEEMATEVLNPMSNSADSSLTYAYVGLDGRALNGISGLSTPAEEDGLTELGFRQAAALAERLQKELRSVKLPHLTLVSRSQRRCVYTMQPAIQALQPQAEHTLCHGGSYEFGCAGKVHPGSSLHELLQEFPELSPVGFSADGFWDYQGCNDKETEPECRARVMRLVSWLMTIARTRGGPKGHTIVLVTHQTINDLLCSILLDGTAAVWKYGQIRYRLQNAGITEAGVCIWPLQR
ncbi:unnamed protein product [Symbiodinium sp. CCMP2592]|nr:unnamed protein product [Symbiodinium sp. CCMP2592]